MFSTRELSRFTGKPVHLFIFQRQTKVWRFNSTDSDLDIGGETYLSAQIERTEIRETAEQAKDKITIRCAFLRDPAAVNTPSTQEFGSQWHPYIPSSRVAVTCLSTHIGETEVAIDWIGQVTQPKFTDVELELICEPTDGHARHRNQGAKFQRACWKSAYSTGLRGCNLVAGPIEIPGTLTAVSGNDITAPEFADPPRSFIGGTVTWDDGGPQSANITGHSGDTITLDNAGSLAVDDDVVANTIPIYTDATLTAVDGLLLTAPEFSDALFNLAGGSLTWVNGEGLTERRSIMSHDDDTITVLYGAADLAVALDVRALPNCPRTWAACEARKNTINYGGAIYKPVKDPMQESMSWG